MSEAPRTIRCAIYTRKSVAEGLEQEFNSLDAQRQSAESFIASQQQEGWIWLAERYDDGGFTGANTDRPAFKRLVADIEAGRIDCVVVYKVDRLSRSLLDFTRIMETFENHGVSFVSVTQQFNTTHSMGRLTLNILLSFAQFEREIISERTRDKFAAARRAGRWSGGIPPLGYDADRSNGSTRLVVNPSEAKRVRQIFELYLEQRSLLKATQILNERGWSMKQWTTRKGNQRGGRRFSKSTLLYLLRNITCCGKLRHGGEVYEGRHESIVPETLYDEVQSLLDRNGRRDPRPRSASGALLNGLLFCAHCGCAMSHSYSSHGSRRYRYYVCGQASRRGWDSCPSKSLPAAAIERFVVEQVLKCDAPRDGEGAPNGVTAIAGHGETTCNGQQQREATLHRLLKRVEYDGATKKVRITVALDTTDEPRVGGRERIPGGGSAEGVRGSGGGGSGGGGVIEREIDFGRGTRGRKELRRQPPELPPPELPVRAPRVSRLMALAIHLEGQLHQGELRDYAQIARLGQVSRARISQIMSLLNLAPDIQEAILLLPPVERGRDPIREPLLRPMAAEPDWSKQRRMWRWRTHHLS